ncbi:MAG: hypothetical protein UDG94_04975 [Peptococcaceae bacterium]|nr:hypothetical protein [Peptococcaceae bacterium]
MKVILNKKWLCFICMLLLFVPTASYGQDKAWIQSQYKDYYYGLLADNLAQLKNTDDSYCVTGTKQTLETFSWDNIQFFVKKPFVQNVINSILHRQDYKDIQNVIEECQHYYVYTICSGFFKLEPNDHFVNENIFQETNARNIYMLFKIPDAGLGCEAGDFSYSLDTVKIDNDVAKVFITRSVKTIDNNPANEDSDCGIVIEEAVREGYLLEKKEGQWKIANILFDNADYLEGDAKRIFNDENQTVNLFRMFEDAEDASIWTERFSFEKCQRKDYCPYGNFMSYIIGDVETPVFNYDKLINERDNTDATLES